MKQVKISMTAKLKLPLNNSLINSDVRRIVNSKIPSDIIYYDFNERLGRPITNHLRMANDYMQRLLNIPMFYDEWTTLFNEELTTMALKARARYDKTT